MSKKTVFDMLANGGANNKQLWESFISDFCEQSAEIEGLPRNISNAVVSVTSAEWFEKPVPTLHGLTPRQLYNMENGEIMLKNLIITIAIGGYL